MCASIYDRETGEIIKTRAHLLEYLGTEAEAIRIIKHKPNANMPSMPYEPEQCKHQDCFCGTNVVQILHKLGWSVDYRNNDGWDLTILVPWSRSKMLFTG